MQPTKRQYHALPPKQTGWRRIAVANCRSRQRKQNCVRNTTAFFVYQGGEAFTALLVQKWEQEGEEIHSVAGFGTLT